jgi:hypothetical protein
MFRWIELLITTGHGVDANCWVIREIRVSPTHVSGNLSLYLSLQAFFEGRELLDNATFAVPYDDLADVNEGWLYEAVADLTEPLSTSHSGPVTVTGATVHVMPMPTPPEPEPEPEPEP